MLNSDLEAVALAAIASAFSQILDAAQRAQDQLEDLPGLHNETGYIERQLSVIHAVAYQWHDKVATLVIDQMRETADETAKILSARK